MPAVMRSFGIMDAMPKLSDPKTYSNGSIRAPGKYVFAVPNFIAREMWIANQTPITMRGLKSVS